MNKREPSWNFDFGLAQIALDAAMTFAKAKEYHEADNAIERAIDRLHSMQSALRVEAYESVRRDR